MKKISVMKLASELYDNIKQFEDDEGQYLKLQDDAPEWMKEIIKTACGDVHLDKIMYEIVSHIVGEISDCRNEKEIKNRIYDLEANTHYKNLTEWLNSHSSNMSYIDESLRERDYKSGYALLMDAQKLQKIEVGFELSKALKEYRDE